MNVPLPVLIMFHDLKTMGFNAWTETGKMWNLDGKSKLNSLCMREDESADINFQHYNLKIIVRE